MAYVEKKLTKELSVHPSFKEDGINQQDRCSEETTNNGKIIVRIYDPRLLNNSLIQMSYLVKNLKKL